MFNILDIDNGFLSWTTDPGIGKKKRALSKSGTDVPTTTSDADYITFIIHLYFEYVYDDSSVIYFKLQKKYPFYMGWKELTPTGLCS